MQLSQTIEAIDQELPDIPFAREGGSLLMMVGLPGVGKSSVARGMRQWVDFVAVSTDSVRLQLRKHPFYTDDEIKFVYTLCHAIIKRRLKRGQRVVFDASNYLQARRHEIAALAQECGAPLTVCYVQASQEVITQRLLARENRQRSSTDLSDANWYVYKWMVETQEPLSEKHLILDTTSTPSETLARTLYEYWLEQEKLAASDADL